MTGVRADHITGGRLRRPTMRKNPHCPLVSTKYTIPVAESLRKIRMPTRRLVARSVVRLAVSQSRAGGPRSHDSGAKTIMIKTRALEAGSVFWRPGVGQQRRWPRSWQPYQLGDRQLLGELGRAGTCATVTPWGQESNYRLAATVNRETEKAN
jgi:hypothetical protein